VSVAMSCVEMLCSIAGLLNKTEDRKIWNTKNGRNILGELEQKINISFFWRKMSIFIIGSY